MDVTSRRTGSQVVCFVVGPYRCAVDILRVREIITPVAITPVPGAPRFVEGLIDLRGVFLPVLDLRKRLGLAAAELGRDGKYVVATSGERRVALIVDAVLDVRRLDDGALQPPPALAVGEGAGCFAGVMRRGDEVLVMLDIDRILDAGEQAELDAMS